MLTPIDLRHLRPDEVLFWSDLHWGHNRDFIYGPRGFKTVEEHDETLVHRWNEVCTDQSTVFHLGDLVFKDPEGKRFEELVRRLRFRTLYLMLGNHTSGHKQVYQRTLKEDYHNSPVHDCIEMYPISWYTWWPKGTSDQGVVFLPQYAEVKVGKADPVVLCHYAIESWNGMGKQWLMLHGHSHGGLARKMGRRRDVGVDCYPAGPVSLSALLHEMRNEKADVVDHHGRADA